MSEFKEVLRLNPQAGVAQMELARLSLVKGEVALNGVKLNYQGLAEPFEDIHGVIAFNNDGATAQVLSARFMQQLLAARILPRAGTHGVIAAEVQ